MMENGGSEASCSGTDESTARAADDPDSLLSGDLGLGQGLKPGGLQPDGDAEVPPPPPPPQAGATRTPAARGDSKLHRILTRSRQRAPADKDAPETCFPVYADIPYGTSLRQQRKLFQQDLSSLMQKHGCCSQIADTYPDLSNFVLRKSKDVGWQNHAHIQQKLSETIQEVEELKLEFETCQQRLDAKYKSITILKQQMYETKMYRDSTEKKNKEENEELIKTVNNLQFELECQETTFIGNQETWAYRFDRVCQDNAALSIAYGQRTEELKKMIAQKMALSRERDELLALLDVQEKNKYERLHSTSEDVKYSCFSSTEFAVLGACICRGYNPDPCGCAYAAANMSREICMLREEIELSHQRHQEALLTVDAYRYAFEEQLMNTKQLMKCVGELANRLPKSKKFKTMSLLKKSSANPFKQQAAEESKECRNGPLLQLTPDHLDLKEFHTDDVVTSLIEMLQERNELLAYQRLGARILANKMREQEQKNTTDCSNGTPS